MRRMPADDLLYADDAFLLGDLAGGCQTAVVTGSRKEDLNEN